jgi:hypothetical protein
MDVLVDHPISMSIVANHPIAHLGEHGWLGDASHPITLRVGVDNPILH